MQGIVMAEQPSRRQARRPKAGLLAALAALGLAGCALVPAPAVQPPPPPTIVAPPVREPVRAAPVAPQPQPVAPAPGLPQDEARNRVAVLVPLSGPNAPVGQSLANAATLALLDAGGERIRLTVYD